MSTSRSHDLSEIALSPACRCEASELHERMEV